jgi:hypothetical protein
MSEEHNAASHVRDFLSGLRTNPNMPNLKVVIGKLTALPGVSQFKGIQIQMLRVQEELLKGQLMFIEQVIEALEATPESAPAADNAAPETPPNGKIIIT